MKNQAFVFDGDDTLWLVEFLYDEARNSAARVVAASGLDPAEWEKIERAADVVNAERFGMSRGRFPTSCAQAYREICRRYGQEAIPSVESEVVKAAARVFEETAPIVEGASEVLKQLSEHGRIALVTKGDPQVQRKRIDDSGLAPLFTLVDIVPEKNRRTFLGVIARLGANAVSSWSIGNSYRSDILPAIEAGMQAVWVQAHVWEYERTRPSVNDASVLVAEHLSMVPKLILRGKRAGPRTS